MPEALIALIGVVLALIMTLITGLVLLSWLVVILPPQLRAMAHRGRQQRTMVEMRALAVATTRYRLDSGRYAERLDDLAPHYVHSVPATDAWGNPWRYRGGRDFEIASLGADGVPGPGPPETWNGEPYESDLVLRNGQFVQAPELSR